MQNLSGVSCVGYIRVSTDKQAGETQTSPADQRAAIEALAAKLGLTVGAWFRDEGFSGATIDKRPAMRELISSCEASPRKGVPGIVIALNDSRWGRFPNPEEATYWRFHLERSGWRVQFVEGDDVTDKMLRPILRAMVQGQATGYRDAIRANAKRGARGTAEQGFWTTRAPYGYRRKVVYPAGRERVLDTGIRKAPDEKVALVVYVPEAAVVRQAFARYAEGLETGRSLVAWLQEHAPGRTWAKPSVMHMLRNPAYRGDVSLGRRMHSGDGNQRDGAWARPESEWFGKRGAHEAIVSPELFDAVQRRMGRNARQARGVAGRYVLSGLLRCETCGAPLIGGGVGSHLVDGERQRFYRCGSIERGITCPGRLGCVSKQRLEGAVIDTITRYFARPTAIRELTRELDRAWADANRGEEPDRVALTKTLKTLQEQRDRLVAAISAGTLSDDEAKTQLHRLRGQIGSTERALRDASARTARQALTAAQRAELIEMATRFPAVAERITGAELRALIVPWLAGGTFNKETRVLTMHLRRLPATVLAPSDDLAMSHSPGQTSQSQTRHVTRRVALTAGRRGWVALGGSR